MMRIGSIVVLVWLVVGAVAAGQRGYYTSPPESCNHVATTAVTIVSGVLNYVGLNPRIDCEAPEPSK
ncbi:MAG: hypothetical protein GEV11_15865 [Streptosporangiales bacterium]|nr:hypothetical protein [Streptosporangiales bacterium]